MDFQDKIVTQFGSAQSLRDYEAFCLSDCANIEASYKKDKALASQIAMDVAARRYQALRASPVLTDARQLAEAKQAMTEASAYHSAMLKDFEQAALRAMNAKRSWILRYMQPR